MAHDREPCCPQPALDAPPGEEPDVTTVQDATLVIVKQTKRRAPTGIPVTKVGYGRDQDAARCKHIADLAENRLGHPDVLEHIRGERSNG